MCQCETRAVLGEPPPSCSEPEPPKKNTPYDVTIHLNGHDLFQDERRTSWFKLAVLWVVLGIFKLTRMGRNMILGPSLGHLGSLVGSRPWLWIVISICLGVGSMLSICIKPPRKDMGFEYGYTTPDAPSIREIRAQKDFFTGGKEGNPWYQALFAEPRDPTKTMHAGKEFKEMKKFYKKIKNMTIRYDEDIDRDITYYDLCGATCDLNELLWTTESMSFFGLSYPVTTLLIYQSNIGKHFYKVNTSSSGDLRSAKVAMLVFMAFYQTKEVKADLSLYERVVQRAVDEHNAGNHSVTFTLHGEGGMSKAVQEGMGYSFHFLGAGVLFSIIVLFSFLLLFGRIFSQFTLIRISMLWMVAIVVPVFSFCTAFAIYNFLGYSITPLTIFTPFLALVSGYYTVIMLTHTWLSDSELRRDSPDEHLLEVFATCMPSLLVTSSPAIAFLICAVYPIPNYASVSCLIGLIITFTTAFSVFFFSPSILLICPARIFSPIPTSSKKEFSTPALKCLEYIRDTYCHYVDNSKFVKVFAIAGIAFLLVIPVYIGCTTVEGNLDYRHLLKEDSPRRHGVYLMSDVVWPTWFSIMFFVSKPPNFSNPLEYGRFKSMIADIEGIENKLPQSTDMVWINDFCRHTKTKPSDDALNMTRFKDFIEDGIYKSWRDGVKFEYVNGSTPVITSMLHIVTFNGTKSLADKAKLFEKCRAVTNKYSEFHTTPFDTEIGFADMVNQVPLVIAAIPFVSAVSMFVVSIIIFGNMSVAVLNFALVCLLYSSCIGFVSLFGVSVNPFNASFFLIIAALSPSFTTHFCYYYQQAIRMNPNAPKASRMNEMLRKCFFPCVASLACCLAVFLPSLFSHVTIFETIAATNLVFCFLGALLAFFLQVILNMLPNMITGTSLFCTPSQ